ncbi:MAG: DUF4189 domain-containing protein [Caulobacteraceae bacterium]|nr:DUF4189 domain-containing protein [Caulobacteraceae bacterium]
MRTSVLAAVAAATLFAASAADARSGQYGALAIDSNAGSAYGWSVNANTQKEADWGALNKCGRNCHVVLRFYTGCGAYAVSDRDTSIYGWAKAPDAATAKARAQQEVRNRGGGKSITIRVWGCNGR